MTTTTATEVSERKRRTGSRSSSSTSQQLLKFNFADDIRFGLERQRELSTRTRFPSDVYRTRPVEFFREILGVEPWSKQIEIIEAVRDYPRVAVCAGHKVSKSHTAAGIALWWYCSWPDARVVMSSTTSRQVDQILWRELRMMRARAGRCVACKLADPDGHVIRAPCEHSGIIEGEQGDLARTGLKSSDFREIVGFTAREAEAVAGISGNRLLYLLDEASGIADPIYEAIEGNRAGGAHVVLLGNGTRNEGEFFDAFNSKAAHYKTIRVSSEETPNVLQRRVVIPGLATYEWIEEKKLEWGEDSPIYRVRIKGEHATNEAGKIFSLHAITQAQERWHETPAHGRLFIGVDPAGESGTGDETAMSVRRGLKQIALHLHLGLNEEQILVHVLQLITHYKLPRETCVVVIDRGGSVGSKLARAMRDFADENQNAFELVALRPPDGAMRQPAIYDRVRDELIGNLEHWFRDGGSILEDAFLEAELHSLNWKPSITGKLKVTPKEILRKILGRSPDRLDALSLSVWEPLSLQDDVPTSARQIATQEATSMGAAVTMDPYAGANAWRR